MSGPPYAHPGSTNPLATVALVLSLVGGVFPPAVIVALVCGHLALSQNKRTGQTGRGQAIAGLVVGYFFVAVFVILALVEIYMVTTHSFI